MQLYRVSPHSVSDSVSTGKTGKGMYNDFITNLAHIDVYVTTCYVPISPCAGIDGCVARALGQCSAFGAWVRLHSVVMDTPYLSTGVKFSVCRD